MERFKDFVALQDRILTDLEVGTDEGCFHVHIIYD